MNEAVPTEYAGTVFRSKSEAMFAKAIENSNCLWEYEPKGFRSDSGWAPDFLIAYNNRGTSGHPKKLILALVEYKPSEPTDTYKAQLFERFKECDKSNLCFYLLFCGSPFNDDIPCAWEYGTSSGVMVDATKTNLVRCLSNQLKSVKGTRFDLLNA